MSDIKTAVLEVDTGGAITNIKEFKEHIEDLKGKLLGLEKGTEEYNTIAKELRESQEKLNEVMDVAKGRGEAVAGSYDNLVYTMRELKKQWRATGDEIERKQLGEKILSINNQLKELDASTGNFQRNVGDYSNAFEKAFDKALGGLSKGNSTLASLAGTIKNLIPVIKSTAQVATTSLSGVKKALASTGIGLLIVALGEILAHWEDIYKWITKVIGVQKDYTAEVKKTKEQTEAVKKSVDELTHQENIIYLRMQLEGVSQVDIVKQKIADIKKDTKDAAGEINKALSSYLKNFVTYNNETLKSLGFSKEQIAYLEKYRDGLHITDDKLKNLSGSEKRNKEVVEAKAEQLQTLISIILNYNTALKNTQNELDETTEKERGKALALKKSSEEALMSETALLTKHYKENKALMEKYGIDTKALTQKYYKDLQNIALKNKVNLTDVIFTSKSGDFDKIKNDITKFFNDIANIENSEAIKRYNSDLSILNSQLDEGTISYEEYLDGLKEISGQYSKDIAEEHYKFKKEALEKEYNENKDKLTKAENDEIRQIQNIADKRKKELDNYLKENKITNSQYLAETKKVEEGATSATTEIHKRYNDTKKNLDTKYLNETQQLTVNKAKETASLALNAIDKEFNNKMKSLNLNKSIQDATKDLPNAIGGLKGLFKDFGAYADIFSTKDIETRLKQEIDYNNQVLQITKDKNEQIIAENEKLLEKLPKGSEDALKAEEAISQAKMDIKNAETENLISNIIAQDNAEEDQAERRKKRLQAYASGLQSLASILDTFAQQQHAEIQQEYKDNKISEETAKKRFEDTKKLQIASAVINMAAGVVSAIAQAQQLGPIAGPIAAAINAAAVITAGVVQIASISKTKFGDGAANTTTPNVATVTNDYTPEYTQNVTADSELSELSNAINSKPVYVSVTDIDSVQNTVKTRDVESTY